MSSRTYEISDLKGRTISSITYGTIGDDTINFYCTDRTVWILYHEQDCCESVRIDDICGDLKDLLDTPILLSEEVTNADGPPGTDESYTWTFYKFATIKGAVTIKWLGESNGYYSESVNLRVLEDV